MVTYKILAFDKVNGVITIKYDDHEPLNFWAPLKDGGYLMGDEFDLWAKVNYYTNTMNWNIPVNYSNAFNAEWIESLVQQ